MSNRPDASPATWTTAQAMMAAIGVLTLYPLYFIVITALKTRKEYLTNQFLPPSDPRVRSTAEAIEHNLISNGLVCRYRTGSKRDGLPGDEGAFLACSCWFVDNLVLLGRHDEARVMFERILGLGNDVGLFSEEYDAKNRRMLGNFPQAFTHVAIITSALNLSKRDKPAEQRSGTMSAG